MNNRNEKESLNPLKYYRDLIEFEGIEKCYKSFQFDYENHFSTSPDKKLFEYFINIQNRFGEYETFKETFSKKLNGKLEDAYLNSILLLDEKFSTLNTKQERKDYLCNILDDLLYLLNQVPNIQTYQQEELIKNSISKLISHLSIKYKSLEISHPLLNNFSQNEEYVGGGFFKFRHKLSDISKLYEILKRLKFLNDEPGEKDKLREIIIQEKPELLDNPIIINCDTQKASYIFSRMGNLFKNLSYKNIEESNSFFTKKGTAITADNISVSINKLNQNDLKKSDIMEEVDVLFENFEKDLK